MKYEVREDSQRLGQFSRKHHFLPVVRITSIIFHTHVFSLSHSHLISRKVFITRFLDDV